MTQNKELRNRPIHLQLIFDQGAKQIQWGKELFLTNGAKTTGYPYEKKNEPQPLLCSIHKNKSELDHRPLNLKASKRKYENVFVSLS